MVAKKLILGSKSPRRHELVKELGLPVEIRTDEIEEIYPSTLAVEEVAAYLAKLKAQPLLGTIKENEILLTSDTTVVFDNQILGKPNDREHAIEMLETLSDNSHKVITGVYLASQDVQRNFSTVTTVHFDKLSLEMITHYVDTFQPFDKAGAYGIQEWIGYIGVKGIEGCYNNVVGLPVHDVYKELHKSFL